MHEDRIVVFIPTTYLKVATDENVGVAITIPAGGRSKGYTLAMSDPGDSLADVVQAARTEWRKLVSAVDALADTNDSWRHRPVKLDFETDNALFQ